MAVVEVNRGPQTAIEGIGAAEPCCRCTQHHERTRGLVEARSISWRLKEKTDESWQGGSLT